MISPLSRLEDLPNEAHINIVRHLSPVPSRFDWKIFVEPSDALWVLQQPGGVSTSASSLFQTITVGKEVGEDVGCMCRKIQGEVGSLHLPKDFSFLLESIIAAGSSIKELRFGDELSVQIGYRHSLLMCALHVRCLALQRLNIADIRDSPLAGQVLRALSGRLRFLTANEEHVQDIARTCEGLRELALVRMVPDMSDLLRVVGPTLESLAVVHVDPQDNPAVLLIQKFCPGLKIIDFEVYRGDASGVYGDMLCSYGIQLRFANTYDMSTTFCAKLTQACPNMLCAMLFCMSTHIEKMGVLGTSIQKLVFIWGDEPLVRYLARAAQKCVNIATIELSVACPIIAADAIRQLLHVEKPMLTEFSLSGLNSGVADDALRDLTQRASSIVRFQGHFSLKSLRSLQLLTTCTHLESVDISLSQRLPDEAIPMDFVKSFAECPRMRHLQVFSKYDKLDPVLASGMQPSKRRAMFASILGVEFSS